jgi:hypothetical protein
VGGRDAHVDDVMRDVAQKLMFFLKNETKKEHVTYLQLFHNGTPYSGKPLYCTFPISFLPLTNSISSIFDSSLSISLSPQDVCVVICKIT